ncbi:hypothetical protein M2372_000724 [Chryseobacterium sp. BIGb0232]|nr:hypothetical protein [Chryseobacterium sp. BIGb0232]ROS19847.1 hypothetical protein EDF65_0545 [Chryseobacterium nakagawai]
MKALQFLGSFSSSVADSCYTLILLTPKLAHLKPYNFLIYVPAIGARIIIVKENYD